MYREPARVEPEPPEVPKYCMRTVVSVHGSFKKFEYLTCKTPPQYYSSIKYATGTEWTCPVCKCVWELRKGYADLWVKYWAKMNE